jgi:hypothetical protein
MRRSLRLFSLVLLIGLAISASASDVRYDRYVNVRFAFGISYPAGTLIPQGEADNGDGQKFLSRDGKTVMLAYGYNNPGEYTLKSVFRDEVAGDKADSSRRTVTYKASKKNWFVVSAIESDKVFYTKVIYKADKDQFNDPIASAISASMKVLPGPFFEEQTRKPKLTERGAAANRP